MELFSADYEENTRALDDLLGVGRCFDMISRDLYVGGRRARLWVVDGYGDAAVIERVLSFWLQLKDVGDAQTMQQFIGSQKLIGTHLRHFGRRIGHYYHGCRCCVRYNRK